MPAEDGSGEEAAEVRLRRLDPAGADVTSGDQVQADTPGRLGIAAEGDAAHRDGLGPGLAGGVAGDQDGLSVAGLQHQKVRRVDVT